MSILPMMMATEVLRRLRRAGFEVVYQKGSHIKLWNPVTKHRTSVPLHGGKNIGRGLLSKILKQAGITIKEFIKL